jgi:hypothetical protein
LDLPAAETLDALNGYYEEHNANVHRGVHRLAEEATAAYEGAREKVPVSSARRTPAASSSPLRYPLLAPCDRRPAQPDDLLVLLQNW